MSKRRIHDASATALLPQLDMWILPGTQESVVRTYEQEIRPISTYTSLTPIRFEVKSPSNEYVMLNETVIWIKLQINLAHTTTQATTFTADTWKTVKVQKNLMHSLFKNVSLSINNLLVTKTPSLYAVKSYVETLLGFSESAKKGHLASVGWNLQNLESFYDAKTPGYVTLELTGKLFLDMALQQKALMGGVDFLLELQPNATSYYVFPGSGYSVTCDFNDVILYVNRCVVSPRIEQAHNKILSQGHPARYPFTRSEIRYKTIPAGMTDDIWSNAVSGVLPRRVLLMLIDLVDFTGNNPFAFGSFNLNYLTCTKNNLQFPVRPFTPDFDKKEINREYLGLYRALNMAEHDPLLTMTRDEWVKNPIFGFNIAADGSDGGSFENHVNVKDEGYLSFAMKFKKVLDKPIVVMLYMEYDSLLEIDTFRNAHVDY